MTLQQLKYIIEIAETGSITMAAQRLFIAQPSLSKSVAELEKEMGITIFNRSNRGRDNRRCANSPQRYRHTVYEQLQPRGHTSHSAK